MNPIELRDSFTASLFQMYKMDSTGKLAEYWQGKLSVLMYVYQHNNAKINPSVLSDALHVSRARITTELSALRKKGYIIMEMCEDDRRRMHVILTTDGKRFIKKKQREIEKHFDILINGLGEENVTEFIRLIDLSISVIKHDNTHD